MNLTEITSKTENQTVTTAIHSDNALKKCQKDCDRLNKDTGD